MNNMENRTTITLGSICAGYRVIPSDYLDDNEILVSRKIFDQLKEKNVIVKVDKNQHT